MKNGKYSSDDGVVLWWQNDKLHREDGPAVELYGVRSSWWVNGERHRIDGPAIDMASGHKEWWFCGKYVACKNQEEFERLIRLKAFW